MSSPLPTIPTDPPDRYWIGSNGERTSTAAKKGAGCLFISHDIDVVRPVRHHAIVLKQGRVVEQGPIDRSPSARHPYTRALLAAVPIPDPRQQAARRVVNAAP
jgi:ABC-type oligopeptide transport system ATPase subunit